MPKWNPPNAAHSVNYEQSSLKKKGQKDKLLPTENINFIKIFFLRKKYLKTVIFNLVYKIKY